MTFPGRVFRARHGSGSAHSSTRCWLGALRGLSRPHGGFFLCIFSASSLNSTQCLQDPAPHLHLSHPFLVVIAPGHLLSFVGSCSVSFMAFLVERDVIARLSGSLWPNKAIFPKAALPHCRVLQIGP